MSGFKIQTNLRAGQGKGQQTNDSTTSDTTCGANQQLVNIDGTGCYCYGDANIGNYIKRGHDVQYC